MNDRSLHRRLNQLKLRLLAIAVGTSVGWGSAVALGITLACMWLDLVLELSPVLADLRRGFSCRGIVAPP